MLQEIQWPDRHKPHNSPPPPSLMGVMDWHAHILEKKRTLKGRYKPKRHKAVPKLSDLLRIREFLRETAQNDYIADRDCLICDFQRVYLLRINETATLNLEKFNFDEGYFIVDAWFEKTRQEKIYSLAFAPEWFLNNLADYIRKHHTNFIKGFLFSNTRGKEDGYIHIDHWIGYRWNKAVKAAGLYDIRYVTEDGKKWSRIGTHAWRAAGITELLEKGVSPRKIAAFTHLHIMTIMNYYWRLQEKEAQFDIMQAHQSINEEHPDYFPKEDSSKE